MTPDDFPLFYRGVHGYDPFPWQTRLLRQVVAQGWPAVLALPTASGKTSAIDIALFSLALEAGKPLAARAAPLRIFFVVDRRLVVDQAARHAAKVRQALAAPEKLEGRKPGEVAAIRAVAEGLARFGGSESLHVTSLRGGMYRDDGWVRTPNQPTVCVSTVDQVGSRLLFRGYGVSEYGWPVHAALCGNDALYLLDEAHLSQPFLETLRAVQTYRGGPWATQPVGGPFRVVEISATPFSEGERFKLGAEDTAEPELRRRLAASKPARLIEPARFESEAVKLATQAQSGDVKVVGVVVNRVASARAIFRALPGEPFADKVLLTGRIRPWDRDCLLETFLSRVEAGRARSESDRPFFVAATMTVEVGADLDFDFLITEAAPLPALRQRFGRLDRLGRFGNAGGAVLFRKAKGPDPVYGDELAQAWKWLRSQANAKDPVVDFGIEEFDRVLGKATEPPPVTAARHAPILFPAHLDALVQTSPPPMPSPDVAPFLHGADAWDAAEVQVVWRADLRIGQEGDWKDVVGAAPPRSREALPLPVGAVRSWLARKAIGEVSDLEGSGGAGETSGESRPALRWRGPDAEGTGIVGAGDVRPGDTLVVPSDYGGADDFGWDPEASVPVADVGDHCVNEMADQAPADGSRRLIRLRLHDAFLERVAPDGGGARLCAFTRQLRTQLEEGDGYQEMLDDLLRALAACPNLAPLTAAVVAQMVSGRPRVTVYPAGVILSARTLPGFASNEGQKASELTDEETDASDTDDTTSLRAGTFTPAVVGLIEHAEGVTRQAEFFAGALGVEAELGTPLSRAAWLHDLGKADWRFQYLLHGDEPGERLLAKSGKDLDFAQRVRVRARSGLPDGFRHEFVSVALLDRQADELLSGLNAEQRQLARFLVGIHHGRGRPFPPIIHDLEPETVTLNWNGSHLSASSNHQLWQLDGGWADEFWALVRHFGYYGLAYLEAILRLADTSRSAQEEREGGNRG